MSNRPLTKKIDLKTTAALEYLHHRGASEGFLKRIEREFLMLPAEWAYVSKDGTHNDRKKAVEKAISQLKRLGRDLNLNAYTKHLSFTELRSSPVNSVDDYEIVFTRAVVRNRPTVGAVLNHIADQISEDANKPMSLELTRKVTLARYVVGGVAKKLFETGFYTQKPNMQIAEIASLILNKKLTSDDVKKMLKRC